MTARVEAERAIADVLAGHDARWMTHGDTRPYDVMYCASPECDWSLRQKVGMTDTECYEFHRAHVASLLADLMAERQAEAWDAGYRKGADDHYQCGDTCKVPTEALNPYRPDPKDTRDE